MEEGVLISHQCTRSSASSCPSKILCVYWLFLLFVVYGYVTLLVDMLSELSKLSLFMLTAVTGLMCVENALVIPNPSCWIV